MTGAMLAPRCICGLGMIQPNPDHDVFSCANCDSVHPEGLVTDRTKVFNAEWKRRFDNGWMDQAA